MYGGSMIVAKSPSSTWCALRNRKMKVLDIFCGVGGLTHGFKEADFEITGVDISESAGRTFELNNESEFIQADLSEVLIQGDYDIVIGGPPCKPWSARAQDLTHID